MNDDVNLNYIFYIIYFIRDKMIDREINSLSSRDRLTGLQEFTAGTISLSISSWRSNDTVDI